MEISNCFTTCIQCRELENLIDLQVAFSYYLYILRGTSEYNNALHKATTTPIVEYANCAERIKYNKPTLYVTALYHARSKCSRIPSATVCWVLDAASCLIRTSSIQKVLVHVVELCFSFTTKFVSLNPFTARCTRYIIV